MTTTEESTRWAIFGSDLLGRGYTAFPKIIQFDRSLSRHARFLYSLLLAYAWDDPYAYPGRERLAADMGCKQDSLSKYLTELDGVWIAITRRGQGNTNLYEFLNSRNGEVLNSQKGDIKKSQKGDTTNKEVTNSTLGAQSANEKSRGNPWLAQLIDLCEEENVYLSDEEIRMHGKNYARLTNKLPSRKLLAVVGKHADRIIHVKQSGKGKQPSPQNIVTDLFGRNTAQTTTEPEDDVRYLN